MEFHGIPWKIFRGAPWKILGHGIPWRVFYFKEFHVFFFMEFHSVFFFHGIVSWNFMDFISMYMYLKVFHGI